ncbi:unnamed protein product [Cylicocyclus nassatus]|uniref:7TM GPCR serpentine receptor class x (Srx) domain-containing protein n=1 Tax=Cylicocyclus nassatus TaxID=53992 RepID=A0AA36HDB8_CYLNA|nr:unnamed protein product [Cylicocyclus nassatus]
MLINATNDTGGLAVEDLSRDTFAVVDLVEGGLILVSCRAIPEKMQFLNLRIGQLSLFFVETAFHCCLCLSINRFLAISYPTLYRQLFTDKVTVITIIFVSLISAFYWAIYFVEGCNFYFDHKYRVWSFGSDPCSVFLSFYIDMAYNVCLFLLVGIIDVATLLQLRSTTKSFLSHLLQTKKKQVQDTILRRRRKEILFFMQTFMNSLIYAFMLVCFHLISRTVSTDFQLFLCTTFIWGFSHAAGGLIVIAFNPQVRRHLLNFRTLKKSLDAISAASTARQHPTTIAPAARQYPTTLF